ncbi:MULTISPECIES: hypothetical protein [Agrobacterium]|uniref:hypothetical protein n=1 Tax=Agrobacterium TaxID=357 RepID=UPI003B9DC8ED
MKRVMMVACMAMLAGCVGANVGGNTDRMNTSYVKEHVIVGKTTKDEVQQLFGSPREKLSDSTGEERWIYEPNGGTNMLAAAGSMLPVPGLSTATRMSEAGQGSRGASLLQISFDKRGVVRRWSM